MDQQNESAAVSNDFLGKEPVGRLLMHLAAPAVAAQLINMLYNMVDRMYIGHIPVVGKLALPGVGVCLPVIMIVSAFAAFTGMGAAPKASISIGQGDTDKAEYILGASFIMQIGMSAVLTAVLLIWDRPMLLLFGASPATIGYAVGYMDIYAVGTVFVQLTLGMNAFITGQGFTKTSMKVAAAGAVSNIVLDPIFIFVLKMGVKGAAAATVISQALSAALALSFLRSRSSVIRLDRRHINFRAKYILPGMALGLAPFVMQSSESVLNICFNSSLLRYHGDTAVAAMTILSSVMLLSMLPSQGIGQGAQPIISYNFGAGNFKRIRETFRLLAVSTLSYTTALWAAAELFPRAFAVLFADDPELIEYTVRALRVYMAATCIFGIQNACQMTFISIGSAASSIVVALVRKVVLLIPLIYILPLFFEDKAFAVFLAEPVADTLAVIFTASLFFVQFRKLRRKMEGQKTSCTSSM